MTFLDVHILLLTFINFVHDDQSFAAKNLSNAFPAFRHPSKSHQPLRCLTQQIKTTSTSLSRSCEPQKRIHSRKTVMTESTSPKELSIWQNHKVFSPTEQCSFSRKTYTPHTTAIITTWIGMTGLRPELRSKGAFTVISNYSMIYPSSEVWGDLRAVKYAFLGSPATMLMQTALIRCGETSHIWEDSFTAR